MSNMNHSLKTAHIFPFLFQIRMDILIQGYTDIGMSQNLAQSLYVESSLDAACGEGMAKRMKIGIRNPNRVNDCLEMALHNAWFDEHFLVSCQKICAVRPLHF